MKAISSILVLLALTAVASATQVMATPYDGIYAWLLNMTLAYASVIGYLGCLGTTHLQSFLWGDGGYAFYYCLYQAQLLDGYDRALKAEA